ncbi:MAG: hypothetical protein IJZ85_00840 [Lachnospiraceae bacterium]|nr:hypothetical protein [Lachnospiraceae bacterium]
MGLNIGNRRELFVDLYLIDKERTTAREWLHSPVRRECVMTNNAAWEANGWVYYTVFEDGDIFRMYYICFPMYNEERTAHKPPFFHICYAESKEGICWHKPNLGICEINGSTDNNVVVITNSMDAFHVFIDKNPDCSPQEKYKGIYTKSGKRKKELWCMTSHDGIHFKEGWMITDKGAFDSYNSVFWDENKNVYVCYARDVHDGADGKRVRDVRVLESKDFKNWSEPKPISYIDSPYDFQMYTNGIQPYFRAPHIYVGFPTRYTERAEWTANYDRLCGAEHRRWRMKFNRRFGLAVTDGLFMCSRDGSNFRRFNEAFVRPGPESAMRWVYGDGYLAYGMLSTKATVGDEDRELSFYASANDWSDGPVQVFRYTLRMDGFVSRGAGFSGGKLVTKPFIFDGENLFVNFSTSAAGHMRIYFEDINGNIAGDYDSGELFGDSIDRMVDFKRPLSDIKGQEVKMCVELYDAEIYSFQFR